MTDPDALQAALAALGLLRDARFRGDSLAERADLLADGDLRALRADLECARRLVGFLRDRLERGAVQNVIKKP